MKQHNKKRCNNVIQNVSTVKIAEYEMLFECIWIYSPKKLNISATRNELRTALESIPDWWFHDIQMMGIYESACDLDALALVSRAPHCSSLRMILTNESISGFAAARKLSQQTTRRLTH
ncbi:hypothetical protein KIN20_002319 [Parelaphostrongylus tenuis]|uniref:Uncharacterized protein n=1 Tax=Parelaphostrongylus tenuis TaxID=148309 RepID=A0AAD5MNE9_PARTN|nr:hypothetical protein KIN20_002319 [Parelaphostrongylus tenuis]